MAVLATKIALSQINIQPQEKVEINITYEPYLKKELITETKIVKSVIGSKPKQNNFPWGWCTYGVASWVDVTWRGDAKDWLQNAQNQGYQTGNEPQEGSIMATNESYYGHVALVENIEGDKITVSEMNYRGFGVVSRRTIKSSSSFIKGYIY